MVVLSATAIFPKGRFYMTGVVGLRAKKRVRCLRLFLSLMDASRAAKSETGKFWQ